MADKLTDNQRLAVFNRGGNLLILLVFDGKYTQRHSLLGQVNLYFDDLNWQPGDGNSYE